MNPRTISTLSRRQAPGGRQTRGFAIVSAIFLLVILAALAAFLVRISTQQQIGASADVQGIRAYQAARAGVEWGLFQHLRNNACAASSSFTPGGNLAGFTVTVQCQGAVSNDENGTTLTIRRIVATACNQPDSGNCPNNTPGDNYIEREVAVVAGR